MYARRLVALFVALLLTTVVATAVPSRGQSADPPIVFVHGNGDTAALWHTIIWRFEPNGYARDRHSMGSSCPYCTLWADGYNGLYPHVKNRAAFVVASPDPPAAQQRFARSRGWRFPMASHAGTTFAQDMGYRARSGAFRPGVSAFRRARERIVRVSDADFRPGDDFCTIWHLLDLLPEGPARWQPKLSYREDRR
jgi:predicted dithiol-disulfide oxidoreductase (DUF899 family)